MAVALMLMASVAVAGVPLVTWFADDFNAILGGTRLRDAPGWSGTGPENKVYSGEVRMQSYSGNTNNSDSYNTTSVAAQSAGVSPQIMHTTVRGFHPDPGGDGNFAYIYMNESGGANMAYWYGWAT